MAALARSCRSDDGPAEAPQADRTLAYFEQIVSDTPDMICRFLPDTTLTFVNRSFAEAHGSTPDRLVGRRIPDIERTLDRAKLLDQLAGLGSHGERYASIETEGRRLDGTIRNTLWLAAIFYDRNRKPVEVQAIGRDVTELRKLHKEIEQKNLELARLNAQLTTANEGLKQFNRVASHDLQEPLRKLKGYSAVLRHAIEEGNQADFETALEVMLDSAERASQLVSEVVRFARVADRRPEPLAIDLATLVDGVIGDLADPVALAGAQVLNGVDPALQIKGDPLQCRQIFLNLISNAVKYRCDTRSCRVEVVVNATQDGGLTVAVKDNGVGFDMAYAQTIFEPFRRLLGRPGPEGFGMGLTIAATAARTQGWSIAVESRVGEGTVFSVAIPASDIVSASRGAISGSSRFEHGVV